MKGANEVDLNKMIMNYKAVLTRQINAAIERNEMDADIGIELIDRPCAAASEDEVWDHFEALFKELAAYHEQRLQQRVIKGAEVLDSLDKQDERYGPYMRLYDSLTTRLQRSHSRRTG